MAQRLVYWLTIVFISINFSLKAQEINEKNATDIICGDEQLNSYLPKLKNKKVALVINQTARVGDKLLLDTLLSEHVNIVKIFVPEHGLRGQADAGADINNEKDIATGIPIISLYGKNQKPNAEHLKDVDIIVYDLQDVGVRFYTYISTLQYVMEASAENNKQLIILDRPNPNGFYVDGPILDTNMRSFVGMQPIPVVYGMTCGEYAKMLVGENWLKGVKKLNMMIIPCKNYDHHKKYNLRYPPSPNLKTMTAVYLYPSLCLFEGTVVSVGRGTELPFQQWGNPEYGDKTKYSFIPQSVIGASKPLYEGKICWGILTAMSQDEALNVIDNKLCLKWLLQAYEWYPEKEKFFNPFFEKLSANKNLKEQIKSGVKEEDIRASWEKEMSGFKLIRKKYLIYSDFE